VALNNYIGLAHRAGKTLAGTAACESGIRRGAVKVLLIQEGLSPSSIDKFKHLCDKNKVDVLVVNGYDRLGLAIGREEIMVIGITDSGFTEKIKYEANYSKSGAF
jgi:ribosomal protein L7Ae-like RNA K-turn-binding protein